MKTFVKKTYSVSVLSLSLSGCAQNQGGKTTETTNNNLITNELKTMDLIKISNENVRKAIEALQSGEKSWYSYFTENPVMTDDGNKINFKDFFAKALGSEKFLTIDKVENDGKDIYGNFKAGNWGTFGVFFKFHQTADGKFDRLDIGQAK